jgi:hypothetical protein
METKPFVLQFGEGKIAVAVTGCGEILFKEYEESRAIGEDDPNFVGLTIDQFDPDIIFSFLNAESIDVLLDQLMIARYQVTGSEAGDE